jgi:hypothetical protein
VTDFLLESRRKKKKVEELQVYMYMEGSRGDFPGGKPFANE